MGACVCGDMLSFCKPEVSKQKRFNNGLRMRFGPATAQKNPWYEPPPPPWRMHAQHGLLQEAGLYLQDLPLSDMTAELLVLALQKAGGCSGHVGRPSPVQLTQEHPPCCRPCGSNVPFHPLLCPELRIQYVRLFLC
jgi:hypothetical protein